MLLAGCSIGGTLCASLSSTSSINVPFAIASAVFGAVLVVVTAAPAVAPPVNAGTAAQAADTTNLRQGGNGIIAIGIAAAVLSFIMNQVAQFFIGGAVFSLVGELNPEQMLIVTSIVGLSVLGVRVPFDLLLGAYLVARARNVFLALGVFLLTYVFCYLIEQTLSMLVGMSGLYNTVTQLGMEAVLPGLAAVFGVPLLAVAVGALGAKLAAYFMRRNR